MAYLPRSSDPRKVTGDQLISEQVEVLAFEKEDAAIIQTAVNDFLITLRSDTEHVAIIRSIDFQLQNIKKGGTEVNTLVAVHYTLVGTDALPYLP